MATPTITLTATLQDFCGNAAGSLANPAKLRIALCGYAQTLPQIAGTATLAQVGPWYYSDTGSGISIELYGNDVITPVNQTYYEIAVIDGSGNMVQCGAYQFFGTRTVDLSNATQIMPPLPPTPVAPLELQYLPCTPQPPVVEGGVYTAPGSIVMVMYNGTAQRSGIDYVPLNATQFTLTFATNADDTVYALCVVAPFEAMPLTYAACMPTPPQAEGATYTAPGDIVLVTYNGITQRAGVDYVVVSSTEFTLNFPTFTGDTVYALYIS